MREYAKISPQFWIGSTGKEIKQLGIETQLTALYLLTCPHANMIGVYYLPITFIVHETGISYKGAVKALRSLAEINFCSYDETLEYVWVHEMAFYQVGGSLKPNDNRVKAINDAYSNLPKLHFLPRFFEKYKDHFFLENTCTSQVPSKPLVSQEKEKEQEQEQEKIVLSGKSNESHKNYKSQAKEILEFLNEKTGRAYRPVETNLKLITARLKSGATAGNCFQVIAKKTREWKGDPKMAEYLRPATLFNATKFEQYVGELVLPKNQEDSL